MVLGMEVEFRLRWMDFDKYGRLQPFALLDMCQDVATLQAEQMGIGRDSMLSKGVVWVVVRQKFEIVKDLCHFQNVKVRTWPHSPTNFSFLRDFFIYDEQGELVAKATSEWVLMDVESRKFAKLSEYYHEEGEYDEARAFDHKPRKLRDFEEGNRPVTTVVPSYTDIDVNGHVNNAKYANFVIDALNPSSRGAIKSFQIDYRHEALPDAALAMHTLVSEGMVQSKGVREDGTVSFACLIELKDAPEA